MPDVRYISCPHLEASESGWYKTAGEGMAIFLDPEGTEVLILCQTCSALVREKIVTSLLKQLVEKGIRSTFYG